MKWRQTDFWKGQVLIDSGANELVRGYHQNEWSSIDLGMPGTKKTHVRVAGGRWIGAGMTANGEYMMYPSRPMGINMEPEIKGPWI